MTSDHATDAITGCCIGQEADDETPGLPNSSRQACTVALNGFHSATRRSHGVICAADTNATGNSQISPPDVAASGVRTDRPMSAPIQEKAYPSSSNSANAAIAFGMP